jgi:HNH endonuclease
MIPSDVLLAAGITASREVALDDNGCAIWPDMIGTNGYGYYKPEPNILICVHRVVYAANVEPIPAGFHIDHVRDRGCRARACFWPLHLEAVTPAENARRAALVRWHQDPSGLRACGHSWGDTRPGRHDCASCHRNKERRRRQSTPSKGLERARFVRQLAAEDWDEVTLSLEAGCSAATIRRILRGEVYAEA